MGSILLVLLFMHLRSYLDVSFFQTLRFLKFLIFHWWKLHFIPLHCNQNTIFKWWELTHSFICCVSDCLHANPFTLCVFTIHWWTCYQETPHVPSEVSPVERGKRTTFSDAQALFLVQRLFCVLRDHSWLYTGPAPGFTPTGTWGNHMGCHRWNLGQPHAGLTHCAIISTHTS